MPAILECFFIILHELMTLKKTRSLIQNNKLLIFTIILIWIATIIGAVIFTKMSNKAGYNTGSGKHPYAFDVLSDNDKGDSCINHNNHTINIIGCSVPHLIPEQLAEDE